MLIIHFIKGLVGEQVAWKDLNDPVLVSVQDLIIVCLLFGCRMCAFFCWMNLRSVPAQCHSSEGDVISATSLVNEWLLVGWDDNVTNSDSDVCVWVGLCLVFNDFAGFFQDRYGSWRNVQNTWLDFCSGPTLYTAGFHSIEARNLRYVGMPEVNNFTIDHSDMMADMREEMLTQISLI